MQQRVGLARTLLHDPKFLILDEPVNGLDPQARIEMRDLLIDLASQGKSLLVTSHILPELARIAAQTDRLYSLPWRGSGLQSGDLVRRSGFDVKAGTGSRDDRNAGYSAGQ